MPKTAVIKLCFNSSHIAQSYSCLAYTVKVPQIPSAVGAASDSVVSIRAASRPVIGTKTGELKRTRILSTPGCLEGVGSFDCSR